MGGDINCIFNSRLDKLGGVPGARHSVALLDVWRERDRDEHFFTWTGRDPRDPPLYIRKRIDFFFNCKSVNHTQIYMPFQPSSYIVTLDEVRSTMEAFVSDINEWMTGNKSKLNNDKTELLIPQAYHRPSPSLDSVYAGTELIKAPESVRNIGVWFDKTLLMKTRVNSVCKTAFYQLRHLPTIRRFLCYQHF